MVPTEQHTGEVAHGQHTADFYRGGNEGCTAYAFQLVKAELQSQCEQQEDNTDFGPGVDVGLSVIVGKKLKCGPVMKPATM